MLYRSYMVASGTGEITADTKFIDGKKDEQISKIVFMFPGQGAQYVTMGRGLYNSNSLFRQILDNCFEIMTKESGVDLKSILFETDNIQNAEKQLALTELTQPSLFIIEYALSKMFEELGIRPACLIGHSIGEYTAACIAGVFDVSTALKIVIKRGQLMQGMESGSMLAVSTGPENLKALKSSLFEIAAENSPSFCTISFRDANSASV